MKEDHCSCCCHISSSENCKECLILHGLESLESTDNENRAIINSRKRSTDEEIKERQIGIFECITNYPDTTQEELAVKYSVSVSTIQRDMDAIKATTPEWANDLAKGGFLHKVRIASARIDNQISRLQHRIDHEDLDPRTEAYLMQKINEFTQSQLNIEVHPVLQDLKKINQKLASLPEHITSAY